MPALFLAISLLSGLFASPGADLASLGAALAAGDGDAIRVLGQRLGAGRLTPALLGPRRDAARAAIAAASHADDAPSLLPILRRLAAAADHSLAAPASRAAAEIASSLDELEIGEAELATDWLAGECAAWRTLAEDAERYADVRVAALEVAARLGQAGQIAGYDLARALTDAEPEVRRAALELAPPPTGPEAQRIAGALADPEPAVALAAAQALCGGLALGDRAGPVLAVIGPAGLGRVADLVGDRSLSYAARRDAVACLAAASDARSRAAVRAFDAARPRWDPRRRR